MNDEKLEDEDIRNRPTITIGATFPLGIFKDWDADCKERFGNSRWRKMWHDHLLAIQFEYLSSTAEGLKLIRNVKEPEQPKTVEEKKKIKLIGGGEEYE